MAEGALMICMIQLSAIVAERGLENYLKHRTQMIEDGNEDKLISSKIKKSVDTIKRSMTPERPGLERQSRIKSVDRKKDNIEVVEDEIPSYKPILKKRDTTPERFNLEKQANSKNISFSDTPIENNPMMKDDKTAKPKNRLSDKFKNIFRDNTPERFMMERQSKPNSLPKPAVNETPNKTNDFFDVRPEEKMDFIYTQKPVIVKNKISNSLQNFVRDITPSRNVLSKVEDSNLEFRKFMSDIMLFCLQEYELQKEFPDSILIRQKDYHSKLIKHLNELQNREQIFDNDIFEKPKVFVPSVPSLPVAVSIPSPTPTIAPVVKVVEEVFTAPKNTVVLANRRFRKKTNLVFQQKIKPEN
jgi:hypothetical protein